MEEGVLCRALALSSRWARTGRTEVWEELSLIERGCEEPARREESVGGLWLAGGVGGPCTVCFSSTGSEVG